jgi:chromosome segregation ATPase
MGDENFTMVSSDVQNQAEESLTFQQIIVRLKESINKKDKRIAELEAENRRLGAGRGNDTLAQRKLQEADKRNFELVRQIDKYRVDLEASKSRVNELEQFRNQIRDNENGDIVINLTNINTRQRQQLEKLEQLKRQLESEITEIKADRLRLAQENERFRMMGFEKDEEIRLLKVQMAAQDSMLQESRQRRQKADAEGGNSRGKVKEERVKTEPEPKNKSEQQQDASLNADEIRRLQEQERINNGKPSDPLPVGKLPKPKKVKRSKKEKIIIPETIIID